MATVTDDFNRADGAIGANYTLAGGSAGNMVILSNDLLCSGSADTYYIRSAETFGNDQEAFIGITSGLNSGTDFAQPGARMSGSGGTLQGYIVYTDGALTEIARINAGSSTVLKTSAATFANGDVVGIRVTGSTTVTIAILKNGVVVDSVTDSSGSRIASGGKIAVGCFSDASLRLDNFSGGDVAAAGNTSITPSTGSVAFSGVAPAVSRNSSIIPLAGALVLAAFAPTLLSVGVRQPTTGALALTGNAPTLQLEVTIRPNAGSLVFAGNQAIAASPGFITPSSGVLNFVGISSDITLTLPSPPAATLALTGAAPLVLTQGVRQPVVSALALTGIAPVVSQNANITPAVGSLTFNGVQASVQSQNLITPNTGTLAFTGVQPALAGVSTRTPIVGALALTGFAPLITTFLSPTIRPNTGAIAFDGQFPTGFGSSSSPGTSVGGTGVSGAGISGAGISGPGISA